MKKPRTTSRDNPKDIGTPPTWDGESESFGTWLRSQREVREIDLRRISDESKISMMYLEAFEQDRFDILPAPVFAKGFLRQYASYVGLDAEEVVNFYEAARRHHEGNEDTDELEHSSPRQSDFRLYGLALGALVIVVLLWWFLARARASVPQDASAPTEPAESASAGGPETVTTGPSAVPPTEAQEQSAASASSQDSLPGPGARERHPLRMTLDFSGECWVEASVDGERRVAENKVQGESLILEASQAVELKIGNVDVVEIEINGRPFEFADVPGTKVRNQRFDLENLDTLLSPRAGRGP